MPDADVIVVGAGLAGLAGLVATAELADAGGRVILLDQEPEASLGGQAFWSLGGLFLVDSPEQRRVRIHDSPRLALQDWLGSAGFDRPEDAWPRRWAEAYVEFAAGEKRQWLYDQGVRFVPTPGWAERGGYLATEHGNSVPRFHVTWGAGPGVLEPSERRVRDGVGRGLVDGRMLQITKDAGASIINPDRMWHYTEGIENWSPIWSRHGIRILPGPSPLWLDARGRRLPVPLFPGFDTLGTLEHLMKTGYDYSWFVLTPEDHRARVCAVRIRAEPRPDLEEPAPGARQPDRQGRPGASRRAWEIRLIDVSCESRGGAGFPEWKIAVARDRRWVRGLASVSAWRITPCRQAASGRASRVTLWSRRWSWATSRRVWRSGSRLRK